MENLHEKSFDTKLPGLDDVDRSKLSPMMQQYYDIKSAHPQHVLFFRLGDFYEMFFDDAVRVSRELELTLTGRDCGLSVRAPMCGIPYHAAETYIKRLLDAGFLIAVCEQLTDPKEKGLVERGIVRIVTPGTLTESSLLDESRNNYVCSVFVREKSFCVAFADLSTGEAYSFVKDNEPALIDEISRFSPVEIIFNEGFLDCKLVQKFIKEHLKSAATLLGDADFDINFRETVLLKQFSKDDLSELSLVRDSAETACLCGLFGYIYETQKACIGRFTVINRYANTQFMAIDITARRNLELTETVRSKEKRGSLLWVLDSTKTSMGRRLLKSFIEKPLMSPGIITNRLEAVDELTKNPIALSEIQSQLSGIYDIERLMTRVMFKSATPRDMRALAQAAGRLPALKDILYNLSAKKLCNLNENIHPLEEISALIENSINDNPPIGLKDGGIIKDGFNDELDRYRKIIGNSEEILAEIERRERDNTGIRTLKIGYNRVFGYYLEVKKSNINAVPETWIRKQTLSNAERYITDELKTLESEILTANERITGIEYDIFCEVRDFTATKLTEAQKTAESVAELDVLASFAAVAGKNNYCKPEIAADGAIDIRAGRHPSLELLLKDEIYVPNDVYLDEGDNKMYIITGPNMSGKSTFMRQTALITLMAQIGSFVPASYAKISLTDRIFTRVGASDDLTSGQSTFMVEMSEVAEILKNATKNSLVILDEVGRGTSTFDGVSIATAVAEHIALDRKLGCKTLFATHYHELIELEGKIGGVKNFSIAVKKRGNEIKFLRKIMPGGIDDSYGIDVAKLSGIPPKVLQRARVVLEKLESERQNPVRREKLQVSLSTMNEQQIIDKIKKVNINEYTPVDALFLLKELIALSQE